MGNFDPRTAIFRAREAYRERARAKAVADRQSAGAEAITEPPIGEGRAYGSADDAVSQPVRDQPRVIPAPDARIPVDSSENGSWSRDSSASETIFAKPEFPISGEPDHGAEQAGMLITAFESKGEEPVTDEEPPPTPSKRPLVDAPAAPATETSYFPADPAEATEREAFPDWYRSDLPRICRTCRDYRPSADGQKGWCANSWAFTHSRVVLEDDPAPCQSAIGDWWLPVDDIWLVAADVSSHGRPTPLLDRLTGQAEQQRRRS